MNIVPKFCLEVFSSRDVFIAHSIYNNGFKWQPIKSCQLMAGELLFTFYEWEVRFLKNKREIWFKRKWHTFLWKEKVQKVTSKIKRFLKSIIKNGVNSYYQNTFIQLNFFKKLGY